MKDKYGKQTIAKNDRALQELNKIYNEKGLNYVVKLLGANKEYVNKILNGEKSIPESNYLVISEETDCTYNYLIGIDNARNDEERDMIVEKATTEYNNTLKKYKKPKDKLGIESKSKQKAQHPYEGKRAQIILKELVTKYSLDILKNELGLETEKAVINLANGNHAISEKHFPVIARLGNCTLQYLYGTSDVRNNEELEKKLKQYEEIKQNLEDEISKLYDEKLKLSAEKDELQSVTLIKDYARDGLNKLNINIDSGISEIEPDIKPLNDNYADIVSSMISDVSLWCTLIETADKLISTKTDLNKLTKFENEHNRNIDIGYNYTTRFTPEDEAEITIMKPFKNHFFKYIATKEQELNKQEIDLELEEHKKTMEMLNNKKKDNNKNA